MKGGVSLIKLISQRRESGTVGVPRAGGPEAGHLFKALAFRRPSVTGDRRLSWNLGWAVKGPYGTGGTQSPVTTRRPDGLGASLDAANKSEWHNITRPEARALGFEALGCRCPVFPVLAPACAAVRLGLLLSEQLSTFNCYNPGKAPLIPSLDGIRFIPRRSVY